jgi:hypothetical protein
MATFRRITKRDDPAQLAAVAARNHALLTEALAIARQIAEGKPEIVREILATATVEGLASALNSKTSAVGYRAEKYKRTWHSLIPWQNLEHTTPALEAESMISTIEGNLHMTETNSWPPLPVQGAARKGKS